jgi:uncharacterized membrane protein
MKQPALATKDDAIPDRVRAGYVAQTFSLAVAIVTALFSSGSLMVAAGLWFAYLPAFEKRDELRGTWLESHLRRQVRTFAIAALSGMAYVYVAEERPLDLPLVQLSATAGAFWVAVRIARGWIAFRAGRPV